MRLKDFDFRVWDNGEQKFRYVERWRNLGIKRTDFRLEDIPDETEIELYTGFRDSNGQRIFEGDILEVKNLRFDESFRVIVFYKKGSKVIKTYDEDEVSLGAEIYLYQNVEAIIEEECKSMHTLEVVGNIHENTDYKEIKWKK